MGKGRYMLKVDLGGVTMLISKTDDEKKAGLGHFGMKVPELQKAVDELKSKGVKSPWKSLKSTPNLPSLSWMRRITCTSNFQKAKSRFPEYLAP